jgi:5'-AMP-activated protein kinase regulatory beta subunit
MQAWLETVPSDVEDPSMMPLPHHVVLNHLYARYHEPDLVVVGATHRYKNKFVTTLFYKPAKEASPPASTVVDGGTETT